MKASRCKNEYFSLAEWKRFSRALFYTIHVVGNFRMIWKIFMKASRCKNEYFSLGEWKRFSRAIFYTVVGNFLMIWNIFHESFKMQKWILFSSWVKKVFKRTILHTMENFRMMWIAREMYFWVPPKISTLNMSTPRIYMYKTVYILGVDILTLTCVFMELQDAIILVLCEEFAHS